MTDRQVLNFVRLYSIFGLFIGVVSLAFIPWYSFYYGTLMLAWILLGLAAIMLIPILAFAALYVFQGPIGRWIFKDEMMVPPED